MSQLLVGDKNCSYAVICRVLRDTEECEANFDNLTKLARDLGVRMEVVNKHISASQASQSGCENALHAILEKWRGNPKKTGIASLQILIDILKDNGDLGPFAVRLEEHFKLDNVKQNVVDEEEDVWDFDKIDKPLSVEVTLPSEIPRGRQDYYKLPVDDKGYALILNIKAFDLQTKRDGSEHDVKYMSDLWRDLGYTTYPGPAALRKEHKTAQEVKNLVEEFKQECVKNRAKSIVIFIGSHGEHEKIVTSDDERLHLYTDIFSKFTTEACDCCEKDEQSQEACKDCTRWLIDIPKMFFVSTCQNFEDEVQVAADGISLGQKYNLAIMFAQFPGFSAFRGKAFGSKFTYALTDVFMKNAHKVDVWQMMRMVIEKLNNAKGNKEYKQLADAHYLGLKKFYFTLNPIN